MPYPKPAGDVARLRALARELIARLEHTFTQPPAAKNEERDILFGKASLTSTLVTLADLVLSLEKAERTGATAQDVPRPLEMQLSDMALVEAFLRRMQGDAPPRDEA